MAATVIARADISKDARAIAWQQLVDLAAQRRANSDESGHVYAVLRSWRGSVSLERRRRTAESLIGRPIPTALFAFFAEDDLSVTQGLARAVQFEGAEWRALLPMLPPPVRALLRHRDDFDEEARRALAVFGAADRIISGPVSPGPEMAAMVDPEPHVVRAPPISAETIAADIAAADTDEDSGTQIRDLMMRIEAFRRDRPPPKPVIRSPFPATKKADTQSIEPDAIDIVPAGDVMLSETGMEMLPAAAAAAEEMPLRAEHFRFETGADGTLIWVDGAPREPLVGISIAATAGSPEYGVDGYAVGAFRRRAPFRDARLTVPGTGVATGEWRISAVPFFGQQDGRFAGYRGTARRPRLDEITRTSSANGLYGSVFRPESLRQLVHELRTPLNAILGFAEMIDGQILGPAARDYRARALEIADEARRLLVAVDDLDTAARVDSNALRLEHAHVDGAAALRRICDDLGPLARERGVELQLSAPLDIGALSVDPVALDRIYSRLLSALVAVSCEGEALTVAFAGEGEVARLRVDRPEALRAQDEHELLDPAYSPDGDWPDAPLLGLGFALRLVRNLAEAAGGQFVIRADRFELVLPLAREEGVLRDEAVHEGA